MSCRRIKWMAKVLTMVKSSNVSNLNKAVGVSREILKASSDEEVMCSSDSVMKCPVWS